MGLLGSNASTCTLGEAVYGTIVASVNNLAYIKSIKKMSSTNGVNMDALEVHGEYLNYFRGDTHFWVICTG